MRTQAWAWALLFLLTAQSFDSRASGREQSEACVLYVGNQSQEDASAWRKLGYVLVEKKDLQQLNSEAYSKILDDRHFALMRTKDKDQFWLSLNQGLSSPYWIPATFQVPPPQKQISTSYSCENIQAQLGILRNTRRAIIETENLLAKRRVSQTRGELILNLEYSYLIHNGFYKYNLAEAKATYLDLLARIRPLQQNKDFFSAWAKVRNLVYSKEADFKLQYCRDNPVMMDAVLGRCTNCVGETYLLAALFEDAGFRPPTGWQFQIQTFRDHIRPVIANAESKKTYDLATGGIGRFKGAILNSEQLYAQLWLGHSTLRPANEIKFVESIPQTYINKPLACLFGTGNRPKKQASALNLALCDRFSEADPPESDDNQSKAKQFSYDEDDPRLTEASKAWSSGGQKSLLEAGLDFIGWIKDGMRGTPWKFSSDILKVAETLAEPEKAQLILSYHENSFTRPVQEVFSVTYLFRKLGFAHLIDAPTRSKEKEWNARRIILPWVLSQGKAGSKLDYLYSNEFFFENDTNKPLFAFKRNELSVFDSNLYEILKEKSAAERVQIVLERIGKTIAHQAQSVAGFNIEKKNTKETLDILLSTAMIPTYSRLEANMRFISNISDGLQTKAYTRTGEVLSYYADPNGSAEIEFEPIEILVRELTHLEQAENQISKIAVIAQRIQKNPVEFLRQVERLDQPNLYQLNFVFPLLDEYFERWVINRQKQKNQSVDFDVEPWRRYIEGSPISQRLIAEVLTHPQYYFTVEPDPEDQLPSIRPFDPVSIQSPKVQDLKISAVRRLPHVDLPQVVNRSHCEGKSSGLQVTTPAGFLFVECQTSGQSGEKQEQKDSRGQKNGSESDLLAADRMGQDSQLREGQQIAEQANGDEKFDAAALKINLSPRERDFPPALTEDIRLGQSLETSQQSLRNGLDPRQEVFLQPRTWKWLLGLARDRVRSVLSDPVGKILLHHASRNQLKEIIGSFPASELWTRFDIVDMDEPHLKLVPWSVQIDMNDHTLDYIRLSNLREAQRGVSVYGEFIHKAYFKVALSELRNGLKNGFQRVTVDEQYSAIVSKKNINPMSLLRAHGGTSNSAAILLRKGRFLGENIVAVELLDSAGTSQDLETFIGLYRDDIREKANWRRILEFDCLVGQMWSCRPENPLPSDSDAIQLSK